ncbi:MAG: TolC family protein [Treponema sp.]|jgi:multidrug efflux system outer membrane protein|nr:TolC family protein [Treponema sp.]
MVFLCLSHNIAAETVIDPDRAVSLALENNLALKKNQIDLAASGYSEKRLWSEIFPTISASASAGYRSALFSGDGFEIDENNRSYSTGIVINLGLNAGIPYSIKNIQLAHRSNILRYEDARNQLSIQIIKKFYALVAERNNLDYLEEILTLAEKQYEKNQVSFRNGLLGELALMQSRLSVENSRYSLSAAGIAYANNLGEFLAALGIAQDTKAALSGELRIVRITADAEALIKQHLPDRPDIVRGRQEIERLEYAEKQTAMQSRAPSLTLSMDWRGSWMYSNPNAPDPFSDSLSGSAAINIPIDPWIPGTARSQSVRRANDSVEKAKLDLSITEDAAKTQIRSLAASLRNSWVSIEIARLSLEVAERSYQLTDQGFRNGTVESLAVEDARNNMANARQRLLQSELSYFNMILDLSAALNIDWKNLINTFGAPNENQ